MYLFHDISCTWQDKIKEKDSVSVSVSIFSSTLLGYYAEGMHANC